MNNDPYIEIIGNDEGFMDNFNGNLFVDFTTSSVVDDVENDELDFDDMMVKSTIAVNCLVGHMKLMRLCAEELTDSHKDYHVVMNFLDKIQEICDECAENGRNLREKLGL